ncbi:hypothetical protein ABLE93_09550 [Xanthobacter sp. KR7-65]|uniref:hypothetical protein n=1 Tax=Xanthobacter sp. KR7-65 TaxID=3156612 RepID=UPI0032B3A7AE
MIASSGAPPGSHPSEADRILAAEYVLGTLDREERRQVRARCASDPPFFSLVRLWERRLSPLHELAVPVIPPPDIWRAISADLRVAPPVPRNTAARGAAPVAEGPRRSAGSDGRPARTGERPGKGAVARVRRLLGIGMGMDGGKPAAATERRARRSHFPPPEAPAKRVSADLLTPEGRTLGGAIREAVAAGLLPQAAPDPAPPPPPRPADAEARLPPPLKLVTPPVRPRPPPEPLKPPPAFMFLEPDPPPSPPDESAAEPSPAGADAASASVAPTPAPDGAAPSLPSASADGDVIFAASEPAPAAVERGGEAASPEPKDRGEGSPVETAADALAGLAPPPAEREAPVTSPDVEPAPEQVVPPAEAFVADTSSSQREPDPAGSTAAPLALPAPAPVSDPGTSLSPELAPSEARSGEPAVVEHPSADPAVGEEATPLPGWAAEVASGEVSALPEDSEAGLVPVPLSAPPAPRAVPWRSVALGLAGLVIALGGVLAYREWFWPGGGQWIGVMQPEALPAVVVRLDPDSGVVFVRAFAPPPAEGEVFRLWIVTPAAGTHLVGSFSAGLSARLPEVAAIGRRGLTSAELVVTREPAERADPKTAGPGGSVLYRGRLVPE